MPMSQPGFGKKTEVTREERDALYAIFQRTAEQPKKK